jgi:hypothetical protein
MISRLGTCLFAAALAVAIVFGPPVPAAHGQTKKEEVELLAAPDAELISADFLEPAVRQAVANGAAALLARIMAEDNIFSVAFPPL